MSRPALYILFVLVIAIGIAACVLMGTGRNARWTQVPRAVYMYDQLPGREEIVRGILEKNDMVVLAVPKEGDPTFISEEGVDRISKEGLRNQYLNFYKKGWTHRIRLGESDVRPSFEINGTKYYVILSSGTEAWQSAKVLDKFVGKEVEIRGKWDSFMIPDYSSPQGVTQFRPRSIREAEAE